MFLDTFLSCIAKQKSVNKMKGAIIKIQVNVPVGF